MPTVLLLHGALGSVQQLSGLRSILLSYKVDVLDLNFSGHAGIPFDLDFGIEQFSNEVEKFIHANQLTGVTVFGYSMGGYVAAWLSLKNPATISRIVTLGTKFDWSPESAEREIKKMNPEKIEMKVPAFARILEHRHHPNDWKLLMNKTVDMMRKLGDDPLLTEQNLKQMKSKVIIVLGDQDDMAELNYSKTVASWIPNSKFVLLENTPHPIEKVDHHQLCDLILYDQSFV